MRLKVQHAFFFLSPLPRSESLHFSIRPRIRTTRGPLRGNPSPLNPWMPSPMMGQADRRVVRPQLARPPSVNMNIDGDKQNPSRSLPEARSAEGQGQGQMTRQR